MYRLTKDSFKHVKTCAGLVCACEGDCVCVPVCACVSVCVLPLARPGMWHTAHNGGEHQSSDKGEENQVDEPLHPVVTQPSQCLNVVLHREEEQRRGGESVVKKVLDLRTFLLKHNTQSDSPCVGCGSRPEQSAGEDQPRWNSAQTGFARDSPARTK